MFAADGFRPETILGQINGRGAAQDPWALIDALRLKIRSSAACRSFSAGWRRLVCTDGTRGEYSVCPFLGDLKYGSDRSRSCRSC